MSVQVMQVVCTDLERRGKGVEGDPIRRIVQYWDFDGVLLAEVDPILGERLNEALAEVGRLRTILQNKAEST